MTVDAGSASIYGTKRLKIVTKDPSVAPLEVDFQYGWPYQRAITITNTGAALTNFQINFTIDTAAIIAAAKMLSAGQDIRITDSDGTTQLPFYVEPGTINTTTTKIWVKVPSVPNGAKTIYIYYGNVNAADIQSATNTFLFFDDFSGDLSKWDLTQSSAGNVSIVGGAMVITGNSGWNINGATSKTVIPRPAIIEWDSKFSTGNVDSLQGYSPKTLNYASGLYFEIGGSTALYRLKDNVRSADYGTLFGTTYTHQKIILKPTAGYTVFYNNVQKEDDAVWSTDNLYVGFQFFRVTNLLYVDNVRVRKYVATEPTCAVGAETVAAGLGSEIQTILKVAESSGNIGIRDSAPSNILTVMQGSLTDPIADSWTTWPCDRTSKIILRELTGPEALPELAKIRLYEWKKKPRRDDISMSKFRAARIGMMIDDPEVPARILAYDLNGNLQGIDLLAYIGFLHVALKELGVKVAALEAQSPP